MVGGGATLHTSLLKRGLWDALTVFVAPLILGEGVAAVGDLGILSPNQGIAFEEFRVEAGAGFARIDARRGETEISKGRQPCLRD
jgi:riboflavin biosynthesis pyrimidine reductase